MGLRTAVHGNRMRLLPFGLLLILGWLFLSLGLVWTQMGVAGDPAGEFIGQVPASGLVGLAVILVTLLFGVYLFAEMGEASPAPEQFPPE